jgi:hypothetical protein
VLRELVIWPWDSLVDDVRSPDLLRGFFGAGIAILLIIGAVRNRLALPWAVLCSAVLGHVAITDLLEQTHSLAIIRYTFIAAPALWVAACLSADRWRATRHFVPMLLLALCLYRAEGPYLARKADWRPLASWIQQRAGRGDLIAFTGPVEEFWRTQSVFLAVRCYTSRDPANAPDVLVMSGPPSDEVREAIRTAREVYVVHGALGAPPLEWLDAERYDTGAVAYPVGLAHRVERRPTAAGQPSTLPATEPAAR